MATLTREPSALLLLLADGRFPTGGHAHSGGLEAAAASGRVRDLATLETFLTGRLATTGVVTAAFAAAAWAGGEPVGLDAELDARTPSPALRAASRKLGRQLLRAVRSVRPGPAFETLAGAIPQGPHQPLVLGTAARAFGLDPHATALAALHEAVTGPATAAVRVLGLDPFGVHAVLAGLAPTLDALATEAAAHADDPPEALPSPSATMLDISAEFHTTWEVRLFAS